MTVQFLPWVRRGLAGTLSNRDSGAALPPRATFGVSVTVNNQAAHVDIATYGPGDVTGLDHTAISRVGPRRDATNVAPDEFAVVEFDEPDLPWIFTPAAAGTDEHLRPWLVLVVLRQDPVGVTINVDQAKPLPVLTITAPSIPADELFDLAQSWAWAHVQVTTATTATAPTAALGSSPGQSLSRIMCPRRLEPNTGYVAALVPAFDVGVAAGLATGGAGAAAGAATAVAGPAWDLTAVGDTIQLPVYYHWEFRTGPAGDFESLARQLEPKFVPDGVGRTPMFVGAAHPALPALAHDGGGIVAMEGALRAIDGPSETLAPALGGWVDALTSIVDATAPAASDGSAADAEAVAPPIYGGWHVNVHRVPTGTTRPRWLRDLNADPRHRAAAGIGADLVRANQEEYVDAAWRQVGDVIAANRLLDIARGLAAIATRIHDRHVVGLDDVRALAFAQRAGARLPFGRITLDAALAESAALPGFNSRSFRRFTSPRNASLRQAIRRVDGELSGTRGAAIAGLAGISAGDFAVDVTTMPDGLRNTRLTGLADELLGAGAPGIDASLVTSLRASVAAHAAAIAPGPTPEITPSPDLGRVGVITDRHLGVLRGTLGLDGDLLARVDELRTLHATPGGGQLAGVIAGPDGLARVDIGRDGQIMARSTGASADITTHVAERLPRSTLPDAGPAATFTGLAPAATVRGGVSLGVAGPVPPDMVAIMRASRADPALAATSLAATVADPQFDAVDVLGDVAAAIGTDGVGFVPPVGPGTEVPTFVTAFGGYRKTAGGIVAAVPAVTPAPALDLQGARTAIVEGSRPRPMIEARLESRLRAGDGRLAAGTFDGRLTIAQEAPLAPVMVGPTLERPLYLDLARYDQGRFLPGAGNIPENSITVVETNPRFVEALMVGVNHEFNRELLWRRYPTDRRGTAFRKFWDRLDDSDDIGPINEWQGANRLGSNAVGDTDGSLVLLVRGQLLRRFPDTVIYAAPSTAQHRIDPAQAPIDPVFAGFLEPDIAFVGFDFDEATAKAGHGTMFVFQEQPAGPRFGLDVPSGPVPAAPTAPPAAWSDLTWGHVAVEPGSFLDAAALTGAPERPLALSAPAVTARYGAHAGHMAAITFQRPFRIAVHSSEILK